MCIRDRAITRVAAGPKGHEVGLALVGCIVLPGDVDEGVVSSAAIPPGSGVGRDTPASPVFAQNPEHGAVGIDRAVRLPPPALALPELPGLSLIHI